MYNQTGRAVMQVASISQGYGFWNHLSWNPLLTWSKCPLYPSICQLPGTSTLFSHTEAIILKRKYIVFEVNCNMTASTHAGTEPDRTSETMTDHEKAPEIHQLGSLQLAIREADLQDYWEVADTHCGAFVPDLGFPMDMLLRLDRVVAMLGGFSLPSDRKRKCLVAVEGKIHAGLKRVGFSFSDFLLAWKSFESGASHELNLERILGILTVDTVAEFLPRRKPTGLRRNGIAYISNVAVRQRMRRRGIAKKLVQEAELLATCWGCRSIALHCDVNNPGALALYSGAGYRLVKAPSGAKWPQPMAVSGSEFYLMMKRLPSRQASAS